MTRTTMTLPIRNAMGTSSIVRLPRRHQLRARFRVPWCRSWPVPSIHARGSDDETNRPLTSSVDSAPARPDCRAGGDGCQGRSGRVAPEFAVRRVRAQGHIPVSSSCRSAGCGLRLAAHGQRLTACADGRGEPPASRASRSNVVSLFFPERPAEGPSSARTRPEMSLASHALRATKGPHLQPLHSLCGRD